MTTRTIGIVGSGVAGSSLAYLARTDLGDAAEIVVFERAPRVGGRIRRISVGGQSVDAGGKYVHSSNESLVALADALELRLSKPAPPRHGPSGIWNGRRFVVRTDCPPRRAHANLVRRYGPSLPALDRLTREFLRRFGRVYRPPVSTAGFATPTDLLCAVGLDHLLGVRGDEYLRSRGVSERAIREYVGAVTRNFYAQNPADVHAFACLVALVGGGTVGSVFTVDGGTIQLPERLLERSNADVRTRTEVRAVEATREAVVVETTAGTAEFDVLFLAAPLASGAVSFDGPVHAPATADFVRLESTFVVGDVDPGYFGTPGRPPGSVATTADAPDPFYDLHRLTTAGTDRHAFAVATRAPAGVGEAPAGADGAPAGADGTGLFAAVDDRRRIRWRAYPEFTPGRRPPAFRLHPRVYYVNAMESAVSAMETQVLASRTVWNLARESEGAPATRDRSA
jgi:prenylcysteine oxidase/farnesylcysteine lyase